ncbi:MAG TPA: hypothetical protein DD666_06230 [Advenella kashmirensis]|uniref:Uncharacterized protein n=1 Tax=Advenella kashmirensis TaxID=310575 RepID=A0A356LDT8_9BURK|nr:hypothetical protein [Advenella kashmirensis]
MQVFARSDERNVRKPAWRTPEYALHRPQRPVEHAVCPRLVNTNPTSLFTILAWLQILVNGNNIKQSSRIQDAYSLAKNLCQLQAFL